MNKTEEETDAQLARRLVADGSLGSLATVAIDPAGFPFGSVMPYCLDADGHPIFLASKLAEHTSNFSKDPKASLLVAESLHGDSTDPLALQRVTLLGKIESAEAAEVEDLYLGRHPSAKGYSGFPDFSYYRLVVESIRYVGGFGRMSWVSVEDYRAAARW